MPETKPQSAVQPLHAKVNPGRWTTKVNIAMVIAVVVVLMIGGGYMLYAFMNPGDVRQDVHENVAPPAGR